MPEVSPSSINTAEATGGTLHSLLAAWAERDSSAAAILAPGWGTMTFGALVDQLEQIGHSLNAYGLGRSDRVAIIAPRGPDAAIAALGIASSAVCVLLNPEATEAESEEILERTSAAALVAPKATRAGAWDAASQLDLTLIEWSAAPDAPAGRLRLECERSPATGCSAAGDPSDVAFVMCSSGTTGRSKLVPARHTHLMARVDKNRRLLGLLPGDRCLNLMPLYYSHGLQLGLIAPLATGGSVICPAVFDEKSFFASLRELRPSWYIASPTHHQTILRWVQERPHGAGDHRLRFAQSGGAPLPGEVQDELEQLFRIPLVESYGATETSLITVNPPGLRKRDSVGISPDGDVAILDEDGRRLSPGVVGEVVVRGPTVIDGYEDDAEANGHAFRDGWYRTGDRGVLDADGYLTLSGRIKEMINRGGEKVSPREVELALLEHPAVAEAMAFAVPHPTLYEEVAAVVTLHPQEHAGESHLRRFLLQRVSRFKVPRRIVIASGLPEEPNGKVRRRDLAAHFGLHGDRPHATVDIAACSPMERILIPLWREALERDDVGPDDDFFLRGGDSLSAVDLIGQIEDELQVTVPLLDLVESPTPRQLAQRLEGDPPGETYDTLRVNVGGEQRALFAVCGLYGHALRLLLIGRELGPDQPFYGLQPPKMDWERAGCHTIPEMAAHYIYRIRAIQPAGPYRLLGSSFGGLAVFEMALQLQAAGEEIALLALLDTEPTTCRWGDVIDQACPSLAPEVEQTLARETATEEAGRRIARAHVSARDAYVLECRFRGELTYFSCTDEARPERPDRRRLWRHFATQGVRWLPVPGRHGAFHLDPQFSVVCTSLRALLL